MRNLTIALASIVIAAGGTAFGQRHNPGLPPNAAAETRRTPEMNGLPPDILAKMDAGATPGPGQTMTDALFATLIAVSGGKTKGQAYDLTTAILGPKWLVQTPNIWGRSGKDLAVPGPCAGCELNAQFELPFCRPFAKCDVGTCVQLAALGPISNPRIGAVMPVCIGHSDLMLDRLYETMINAPSLVDIATLDEPTGRFLATIKNGVTALARTGRPVTVRILSGQIIGNAQQSAAGINRIKKLLHTLAEDAANVKGSRVTVMAATASFGPFWRHWNHAKIFASDVRAIVGGHNLWDGDYLRRAPIHDVSIDIGGPAVTSAHAFLNPMWNKVCSGDARRVDPGTSVSVEGCPAPENMRPLPHVGTVKVLAVGNYAKGVMPADVRGDMSDIARIAAFRAAKSVIRISQQNMIGLGHDVPLETMKALVEGARRGVQVYIVQTNPDAKSGASAAYSTGMPPAAVMSSMMNIATNLEQGPRYKRVAAAQTYLCSNVHLTTIRFGPDEEWPGGKKIGNHAKVWIVDDKIFYVGSDNIYPASLQEFGYIIDDAGAMETFLKDYWNPLWQASSRVALSGNATGPCIFDSKRK